MTVYERMSHKFTVYQSLDSTSHYVSQHSIILNSFYLSDPLIRSIPRPFPLFFLHFLYHFPFLHPPPFLELYFLFFSAFSSYSSLTPPSLPLPTHQPTLLNPLPLPLSLPLSLSL